ncbi:MAG: envelope stress response membrane protein PspB [Parashewanella sp.]
MVSDIIIAPIIIFMMIVAPLWLVLHYRSKKQVSQGFSDDEYKLLNELIERGDKMASRIETLEKLLDSESPDWRKKDDQSS